MRASQCRLRDYAEISAGVYSVSLRLKYARRCRIARVSLAIVKRQSLFRSLLSLVSLFFSLGFLNFPAYRVITVREKGETRHRRTLYVSLACVAARESSVSGCN